MSLSFVVDFHRTNQPIQELVSIMVHYSTPVVFKFGTNSISSCVPYTLTFENASGMILTKGLQ